MKFTDNKIIKVLECCTNSLDCPAVCPLYEYAGDCFLALHKPTLDLINRQQAEIERLQKEGEEAVSCFHRMESLYNIKRVELKVAKAEAIKEFAERLKEEEFASGVFGSSYCREKIDDLVKEMVGETE